MSNFSPPPEIDCFRLGMRLLLSEVRPPSPNSSAFCRLPIHVQMPSSLPASSLMSVARGASKAMPHSPNVTVAVDAGLLISRLAARYAHPPATCGRRMSPRASCQQSLGALPHRLGSSSSSTALRTLVRSDEPRVGLSSAVRRRLHPPSRPTAPCALTGRAKSPCHFRSTACPVLKSKTIEGNMQEHLDTTIRRKLLIRSGMNHPVFHLRLV